LVQGIQISSTGESIEGALGVIDGLA
jgi:hypothetical protein